MNLYTFVGRQLKDLREQQKQHYPVATTNNSKIKTNTQKKNRHKLNGTHITQRRTEDSLKKKCIQNKVVVYADEPNGKCLGEI